MINLQDYSILTVSLTGLVICLAACGFGWRLATLSAGRAGGGNVNALESALLGLLALIIGFTFAMALSRSEARRDAVLNEANAIGTTALRARLLPEPHRSDSLKLLREYVEIRLAVTQGGPSAAEIKAVVDRSNHIQEALWRQAMAMAEKDKNLVPTGLFIQTLNEMIDSQAKRLGALRNSVPNIVLIGLFGIAAAGAGFVGYASGLDGRGTRWPAGIMAVLPMLVIVMIVDLDRPGSGFFTTSQQAMQDTRDSIAAFPD